MGASLRGPGTVARRWGLMAATAALLAGCVPFAVDDPSASPSFNYSPPAEAREAAEASREHLDYTIDFPEGWSDLSEEYLAENPTSVLSGFWTMGTETETGMPFATMSLNLLDPAKYDSDASEAAAERWAADLENPERGDSGYLETVDGGVVTWASVTGELGGATRTTHFAHIFYGPYFMYVAIEAPAGDEDSSHALLDALQTVTITGPVDLGDRAGAPLPVDGSWSAYCGTLAAPVQAGWEYRFDPAYDGTAWKCPESVDYLGEWQMHEGAVPYAVRVERALNATLAERLDYLTTPSTVGEKATTPNGFEIELLAREPYVAPNGSVGVLLDTATTPPGEQVSYVARLYAYEDDQGGVVEVFVYNREQNVIPDTAWLEPFIATITTPEAS